MVARPGLVPTSFSVHCTYSQSEIATRTRYPVTPCLLLCNLSLGLFRLCSSDFLFFNFRWNPYCPAICLGIGEGGRECCLPGGFLLSATVLPHSSHYLFWLQLRCEMNDQWNNLVFPAWLSSTLTIIASCEMLRTSRIPEPLDQSPLQVLLTLIMFKFSHSDISKEMNSPRRTPFSGTQPWSCICVLELSIKMLFQFDPTVW